MGRNAHMIFPDRDVDLGIVGDDELIITGERRTPSGVRLEAYKMHKDDPRAQSLAPQQWASETLKDFRPMARLGKMLRYTAQRMSWPSRGASPEA